MLVVERPLLPGDVSPKRTVSPAGTGALPGSVRPFPDRRRAF
jgi:hypothetical protein